jgi:FAD:protein FMN transferase
MGGNAHLIAVAGQPGAAEAALDVGRDRLRELERCWSRFRPDSEICALRHGDGAPVRVSGDTRLLVSSCVEAWRRSRGRFDASTLVALEGLGYDRSWTLLAGGQKGPPTPPGCPRPAPGCAGIVIDDEEGTVTLPAGVALDPGGIGKGLAADLATAAMLGAGAKGACVNLAGDVRARGAGVGPADTPWLIGVEHPVLAGEVLATIRLPVGGGAVASSSVLVRRWADGRHHVIDPQDGRPSTSEVVAATVVADRGVWADAATKIALVCARHQQALAELEELGVAALLVLADNRVVPTSHLAADVGGWHLP